ncbi:solute carrier family 35 member F2-like [Asterias rubens]|uniref:solute carrier family 35 member F2-like n=1 Tax=Asterias rubens TaxID=7604 RepID=UPI0014558CB6|nr:solute carrier family 35 member F2-like [Asterias rubens]
MENEVNARGTSSQGICSRFLSHLGILIGRLFTTNFLKILIGGQLLSLLICGTAITSQLLFDKYQVSAPTAQSFLNYLLLAVVYCVILACRRNPQDNLFEVFKARWWKYIIVAFVDVEANYLIVKAYHFTTLTSIQLLDCITIPVVLILSFLVLRVRFGKNHILGVVICVIGVPLMVWADSMKDTPEEDKPQKALGDALCLAGASLYGFSNVAEEYAVRHFSRVEFLGMLGLFGTFISGIQLIILERGELTALVWRYEVVLLFLAFAICLFCLYSLFPLVIKWSSALTVNLSILTADVYSLIISIFVFKYTFNALYLASFSVILVGIVVYSLLPTREAASNSRYNLFKDEPGMNSESEERPALHTATGPEELTEEEKESWHKAASESLNGKSGDSEA